jgi:superfamily II DNA/RNA helicase
MLQFVLDKVKTLLQMQSDTRDIRLSNDHPNVHLATLQMLDPLNSCHDIVCVIQFDGNPPLPPFMVFCNDRRETEHLCLYACLLAPAHFVDKLLWFHSGMSSHFHTNTIEKLRTHKIWGIFCTDAARMVCVVVWLWVMLIVCQGLDLRDIELVVQWRYMSSLCTLWQRLGQAAWDPSIEVTGIYMVCHGSDGKDP